MLVILIKWTKMLHFRSKFLKFRFNVIDFYQNFCDFNKILMSTEIFESLNKNFDISTKMAVRFRPKCSKFPTKKIDILYIMLLILSKILEFFTRTFYFLTEMIEISTKMLTVLTKMFELFEIFTKIFKFRPRCQIVRPKY